MGVLLSSRIWEFLSFSEASKPLTYMILLLTTYVSWYAWRFVVGPALRHQEPQEMPYWVPGLGHTLSFFQDSERLFTRCREYFGNTRRPFRVTLLGQTMYVVTSPEDTNAVYRNNVTLQFNHLINHLMRALGASEDAIEKLWHVPPPTQGSEKRIAGKPMVQIVEDYYRQQFLPGDGHDELWRHIFLRLEHMMRLEHLPADCVVADLGSTKKLSLWKWSRSVLLDAVARTMFGDKLLNEIAPELLRDFVAYDDESWKLMYQIPPIFARDMYAARRRIFDTFEQYLHLKDADRADAVWVVRMFIASLRDIKLSERDIASLLIMPLWASNSNAYKACFWVMTYLVYHPDTYVAVRAEVDEAVAQSGEDPKALAERLETACPLLMSIYTETLRVNTASASVRSISEPTSIGGLTLPRGCMVIVPYRQLHFDQMVYDHADRFDAGRFVKKANLAKGASFRPFGGGVTYCSGRLVAQREVMAFVALALVRFNVELVLEEADGVPRSPTGMPEADEKKTTLGMLPPKQGPEVVVRVSLRK